VSEAQRPVLEDDEQPVDPERESAYGISRLMAFSDGVFSIAITLLVLDVPVPVIAQSDATSRLPAALLHTGPRILTFALSFFLVGFYWIRHHQLFSRLVSANVWLLWLNLVVLFLVCMLPFSSGVVGRYGDTVAGAEVYAVNLAAIALAFSALNLYAIRGRQVVVQKGAGTGFVSRGLYLPLVVVALVMLLAPVNLLASYVVGVTLMALVGVYTAIPRAIQSAPLSGTGEGRLRVRGAAANVTIGGGAPRSELFHARFTGPEPIVRVRRNAVDVEYRRSVNPLRWRTQSAHLMLNAAIPWQFELWGGAYRMTVDLTGLGVTGVTLTGGAEEVVLRLPRPSGTVPVRLLGGAEHISMERPDGIAVRALVRGGVGRLQLDARVVETDGEGTTVESPDYADVADRYDVELAGGASDISISSV
jgi:uncharacterized membrane protein